MDPITLATLITSISTLLVTIFNRVHSSKCFGDNGIDVEFDNNTPAATAIPMLPIPVTQVK